MNKIIDIKYIIDDEYDYINIYLNNDKIIKIGIDNQKYDDEDNYGLFIITPDDFDYNNKEYDVIKIQFNNNIYINKNIYEYNHEIIEIITNNDRIYIILYATGTFGDEYDNNREIFMDYIYNDKIFSQKLTL